eukprot:TRINITY_DN5665_c0_g1_i1.p1 TRINITY_DN5665_c0_g1~~TRINITY_DN5665_c0_g1_i1.p1  ORF type:complete len:216 (+),score=35.29 TRINITY_DN5665_c0_g1_i1:1-648(+)
MAQPAEFSEQQLHQWFEEFLTAIAPNGWIPNDQGKLGVQLSQKTVEGNTIPMVKGEGTIKASAATVADLLMNITRRGEWDKLFDSGRIVKDYGDFGGKIMKCSAVHYKTKSSMTVWSRDFAIVAACRKETDGKYVLVARSIVSPAIPEVKGNVRGNLILSGFTIEPISDNECRIVYMFQVDVAGWIPASIVQMVNTTQPLGILGMRKALTGSSDP